MNGLLNGLVVYGNLLDTSLAVGPGPLTNGNAVPFHTGGPVPFEGYAAIDGIGSNQYLKIPPSAVLGIDSTDFLFYQWVRGTLATNLSAGLNAYVGSVAGNGDGFAVGVGATADVLAFLEGHDDSKTPVTTPGGVWLANTWQPVLVWFQSATNQLLLQVGNTVYGPFTPAVANGAAQSNALWLGTAADAGAATLDSGSFGLWKGTIPDAIGRAALVAGTPFSQFDNGKPLPAVGVNANVRGTPICDITGTLQPAGQWASQPFDTSQIDGVAVDINLTVAPATSFNVRLERLGADQQWYPFWTPATPLTASGKISTTVGLGMEQSIGLPGQCRLTALVVGNGATYSGGVTVAS